MFHTMGTSILYNKPFVKYKLENLRDKLTSINWTDYLRENSVQHEVRAHAPTVFNDLYRCL